MEPVVRHPAQALVWLYTTSALSIAAALVHLAVAPGYFALWPGYGFFFVAAVTAQIAFAVTLWVYPSLWADNLHPLLLWAGILGNALIIGMWLLTRVVGIPLGPTAGQVLPVGWLDLVTVMLELAIIAAVVRLIRIYSRRPPAT